jgi:RNA polymerase sigma-70 factor (ECF subfamily)
MRWRSDADARTAGTVDGSSFGRWRIEEDGIADPRGVIAGPNDTELVRAFVRGGDEEAFRALFRRHTPAMFALASRLLGGAERGADDAVQEAWSRAARRLGGFRGESALSTWLGGIVVRCCREALRRRRPQDDAGPEPAGRPRPLEAAIDVGRALEALPDGMREVVVLHDVEGWSHREIAARLGIRTGSSKSRLSRARELLRERLRRREGIHER